jgi:hypothetical protein
MRLATDELNLTLVVSRRFAASPERVFDARGRYLLVLNHDDVVPSQTGIFGCLCAWRIL